MLDLTAPTAGAFWASYAASDLVMWAEIAGQARQGWRMMGVAQQVTFRPGDIRTVEFPQSAFDLVRFGAVLYFFNPDQVVSLLARANRALKSSGVVVISSLQADEGRCEAAVPLLNAVDFFIASPYSEVYSFGDYRSFLEAAGFTAVARHSDYFISAHR